MSAVRVAVLAGGRSSEHDISVASARSVVEGLRAAGHEPVEIAIGRDGRWQLPPAPLGEVASSRPCRGHGGGALVPLPTEAPLPSSLGTVDVVFPVLHGPFGEDGTVQGLLELLDLPYVGPGVAASAVAMDKALFKDVLRANGIPVTPSTTFRDRDRGRIENRHGLPVVVKPARLGSSVGISVVRDAADFEHAVELALAHDDKILVEEYVAGVEVECSVLGNADPVASTVGEIVPLASDWYDFESKYADGGMELVVPARITGAQTRRVQELAVAAFGACECEGMARVDFFVRTDGEVLVNELNTIPGFTATSVYAKLFAASGIAYPELLDRLVALALERHARRAALRY
jgi:D-alanine-D-alanine ligase